MTTRRGFLERAAGAGLVAAAPSLAPRTSHLAPRSSALALPTPAQRAWQDLEVGMFVHFGPNTWQNREYDDRSLPPSAIMPNVDAAQWADTAVALGANYVVLVAKHVGGFCLWQTDTTGYSIRSTPWKAGRGDVCADLAAACRDRGLGLGVYLSPRDDSQGAATSGRCRTREEQDRYDAYYRRQLTELLTGYGPIVELWLDGSSVVPTHDIVQEHAPNAMVFQGPDCTIRWVGNEDGFAPYPAWNAVDPRDRLTGTSTAIHSDPDGASWLPIEVDVSVRRPNWFWSTTNQSNLLGLEALLEIYYRSVGRGCQLLLNMPPDRTGRIPEADADRAREFGEAIRRRFGRATAENSGNHRLLTALPHVSGAVIDHVVLEEDLEFGERVRAYEIEASVGGTWTHLGSGTAIGHKRIHPVPPTSCGGLRLVVTDTVDTPHIRRFAAFETGEAPPATWQDPVALWAEDDAGRWSSELLDIDLTPKIDAAALWRVRVVAPGGPQVRIERAELLIGGSNQPQLVSQDSARPDRLLLTITQLGQPIVLRARVRGAHAGTILLRRV